MDEPTSAEWVIGEWVTLDRELHPFEALELATVIEAVKLHVLHGWPRWWAWTFASLAAQIAIGILEAAAGELRARADDPDQQPADDRGSVSCGLPVDAAVPLDALPRDQGDLDRPQTACPQAPTGVVVVVGIHKGVGGFSTTTPGEI